MFKLQIAVPGGTLEIAGDQQKELIRQAAFFQSLPTVCPVDGSPTAFLYKNPDDNEYFGLVSTGPDRRYEFKIGQHRNGQTLFAKDQWVYWDGQKEVVVWENGQFKNGFGLAKADAAPKLEPKAQPVQHRRPQPAQPAEAEDDDNPFTDPLAGLEGEKALPYKEIADSLEGHCATFAQWAYQKHIAPDTGPASKQKYSDLLAALKWAVGTDNTVVLSVLCRGYMTADQPCSDKLAGVLLEYIPSKIARRDAQGKVVKVDGLIVYDDNPKYKPEYADCLREIAEAVKNRRQPA